MIAIIAAMDNEVEILKRSTENVETGRVCGMEYTKGSISGTPTVVIKSGIGKSAAASAATVAIAVFGATAVINTGLAAGKFPIGTIMIADRCLQYDVDMTVDGVPMGQNSEFDSLYYTADFGLSKTLACALDKAGVDYEHTTIASGDAFVSDAEVMRRICADFDAGGVEMESGSVGQICTRAGVPFAILRAVSDNGNSHADYVTFAPKVCEVFSSALLMAIPLFSRG